jgi:8-oxo-dGTP pyrophosphatase MutT (NUDIX family)
VADPARQPDIPAWLEPIREGADSITVHDLTRFMPPEGSDPRRGAVLMLFGEDEDGERELLLIERSHTMRSHPGQIAFPGGGIDPGETAYDAALREAWEETGLEPEGVVVFAQLPELWLPPSNFAVTPMLGWWEQPSPVTTHSYEEVHAIHMVPIADLVEPTHRVSVKHPSGWVGPGFLIGADRDIILWGFTAGIISRLFEHVGWSREWDAERVVDLPDYMFRGQPTDTAKPNTRFQEGPGR